jgi:glutamate/aspartate transport system substrate-binding protein
MGYPPRSCAQAAGLVAAVVLLATAAGAQTGGSEGLSPTLANIKKAHAVRLGYRESSPPFSFLDLANRPIGYSLELCEAIVDEIGVEVDDANLKIEYVTVTSDDRIAAVVQNKIDLECGSTTANAERGKQVAFSPLIFVAGTKLMVPKASTVSGPADLKGKTQKAPPTSRRCMLSTGNLRSASTSLRHPITSSPIRCSRTARPMRSRPTTSCSTA